MSTLSGKNCPFHLAHWWHYEFWIQRIDMGINNMWYLIENECLIEYSNPNISSGDFITGIEVSDKQPYWSTNLLGLPLDCADWPGYPGQSCAPCVHAIIMHLKEEWRCPCKCCNHFKRQIEGQQWTITKESYVGLHKPMVRFSGPPPPNFFLGGMHIFPNIDGFRQNNSQGFYNS